MIILDVGDVFLIFGIGGSIFGFLLGLVRIPTIVASLLAATAGLLLVLFLGNKMEVYLYSLDVLKIGGLVLGSTTFGAVLGYPVGLLFSLMIGRLFNSVFK